MWLIVGLGNPGPRYVSSRHNVGFRVAEAFARRHGIRLLPSSCDGDFGSARVLGQRVAILLPTTYMNSSGHSLAAALEMLRPDASNPEILVVYDDLDLPFGRLRLRPSGGSGGHRGIESIIERLRDSGFARLRVGIGRPPGESSAVDHVLENFSPVEEEELAQRGFGLAVDALDAVIQLGIDAAMTRFNAEREGESDGVM